MNYKGYCLWADDIPNAKAPHYIVIASKKNEEGFVLVLAISSIKYNQDGSSKYYDTACKVNIGDITDNDGNNIITKPSFVRYQYAVEMHQDAIFTKQIKRKYRYKSKLSDDLLKRIQNGAKISTELEPRFRKYFDFF